MLGNSKEKESELTIPMRDMNVKIESCNTGYKEVICTHGFGDMNNNGKRLADIRLEHKVVKDRPVFHSKDCTDLAAGSAAKHSANHESLERYL